ncbi:hypothetical protein RJ641_026723 [Dillenia turbinata]|uniref:RING-type domain-containing protein n=1 Tax=Dillenia turbinata TaxID=194707 RepID=A0AAN8W438_9MAGN
MDKKSSKQGSSKSKTREIGKGSSSQSNNSGSSAVAAPEQTDNEFTIVDLSVLMPHFTCILCCGLMEEITTINICLHSFCKKCIYKKLGEEGENKCPTCKTDLGANPVDTLRPDPGMRNLQEVIFKEGIACETRKRNSTSSSSNSKAPKDASHSHPGAYQTSSDIRNYNISIVLGIDLLLLRTRDKKLSASYIQKHLAVLNLQDESENHKQNPRKPTKTNTIPNFNFSPSPMPQQVQNDITSSSKSNPLPSPFSTTLETLKTLIGFKFHNIPHAMTHSSFSGENNKASFLFNKFEIASVRHFAVSLSASVNSILLIPSQVYHYSDPLHYTIVSEFYHRDAAMVFSEFQLY